VTPARIPPPSDDDIPRPVPSPAEPPAVDIEVDIPADDLLEEEFTEAKTALERRCTSCGAYPHPDDQFCLICGRDLPRVFQLGGR